MPGNDKHRDLNIAMRLFDHYVLGGLLLATLLESYHNVPAVFWSDDDVRTFAWVAFTARIAARTLAATLVLIVLSA